MITGFLEGRVNKDHILIMEYEGRVSRVLCRIISRLGLEPVPAGDYASFKALYDEHQPGFILLSLDSPKDDRSDVCRYLVESQSPATIILLSNMDEDKLRGFERTGRSAGLNMGGILRKPVDKTSLQSKLEQLIRQDQETNFNQRNTSSRNNHGTDDSPGSGVESDLCKSGQTLSGISVVTGMADRNRMIA